MNKSESLVATLLVIYGCLCAISIALYALIQLFVDDKPTATNLLIWSATIFAPIAVLMTYTNWKEQKSSELIANECKDGTKIIFESCKILNDIKRNLSLKPDIGLKNELAKDIVSFDDLFGSLLKNSLFLNDLTFEDELYDLILEIEKDKQTIKQIVELEIKFYGLKGTSRFNEYYERYIGNADKIMSIMRKHILYQKTKY